MSRRKDHAGRWVRERQAENHYGKFHLAVTGGHADRAPTRCGRNVYGYAAGIDSQPTVAVSQQCGSCRRGAR